LQTALSQLLTHPWHRVRVRNQFALEVLGCTDGKMEEKAEGSGCFDLDEAKCKDGQYDRKLEKTSRRSRCRDQAWPKPVPRSSNADFLERLLTLSANALHVGRVVRSAAAKLPH
jgi:hypothetical protein